MEAWTDDQEIALLKAVMKWKPVGMHRHFRMLAIREYLLMEGVISSEDAYTKIPGIWDKLGSLYDLSTLDEREDLVLNGTIEDASGQFTAFCLPSDEYGEKMFERRLKPEGTDSPAMRFSRRESTVADTDEPRSSPVSARGSGRNARASARKTKGSKLQNEVEHSRTSKATSTADDETMEDADEESEGREEGESEQEGKAKTGKKSARRAQKSQATRNRAKRVRRR
jgi:MRG-binding protein